MYKLTRFEAADILKISTRSLDRYIKSWRIRSQKVWKIVYVNNNDVNALLWLNSSAWVILNSSDINKKDWVDNLDLSSDEESLNRHNIIRKTDFDKISQTFERVFNDLRSDLDKKDEKIQELSIEIWRKDELLKNSIPIIDYKKSQFLLEENKNHINSELNKLKEEKISILNKLKYEKETKMILLAILFILIVIIISVILFIKF